MTSPSPPSERFRAVDIFLADLVSGRHEVPCDHLIVGQDRPDHRVDAGIPVDNHFEKRRRPDLGPACGSAIANHRNTLEDFDLIVDAVVKLGKG